MVPAPEREPSTRLLLGLLLVAALVPRLVVFPVNENLYGDAVVRTELAERWLQEPRLIRSFGDGAQQFGPLHLYLVGAALVGVEREHAGRAVSLLFGVLSVVPLFALTRRFFGWRAGVWACLAFSVWGMHLQLSTTAASEAVALFFMLWVFALFAQALEENRFGPLFGAAMVLNLACALRYDAWMYIPLLAVMPLLWRKDKVAGVTMAVAFGLLCLPFPLWWMQGNELAHGDPLYPISYIDEFHRGWVARRDGGWREPVVARAGAGVLAGDRARHAHAGGGAAGDGGDARRRGASGRRRGGWCSRRWCPRRTTRSEAAVLLNFMPLGRFTVTQVVLLLPFVALGALGVRARVGRAGRPGGGRGEHRAGGGDAGGDGASSPSAWMGAGGRCCGPVSPTSTNPQPVMRAARWLEAEVAGKGKSLALDSDGRYQDLQLGFFVGLPDERLVRMRWPDFRAEARTGAARVPRALRWGRTRRVSPG